MTKDNGKSDVFNNTKLEGNIEYNLKRDPETKKFPTFTIECDLKGFVEGDLYTLVCIPHTKFISDNLFKWGDDRTKRSVEINANEMDPTKRNKIPVYIFVYPIDHLFPDDIWSRWELKEEEEKVE